MIQLPPHGHVGASVWRAVEQDPQQRSLGLAETTDGAASAGVGAGRGRRTLSASYFAAATRAARSAACGSRSGPSTA